MQYIHYFDFNCYDLFCEYIGASSNESKWINYVSFNYLNHRAHREQ